MSYNTIELDENSIISIEDYNQYHHDLTLTHIANENLINDKNNIFREDDINNLDKFIPSTNEFETMESDDSIEYSMLNDLSKMHVPPIDTINDISELNKSKEINNEKNVDTEKVKRKRGRPSNNKTTKLLYLVEYNIESYEKILNKKPFILNERDEVKCTWCSKFHPPRYNKNNRMVRICEECSNKKKKYNSRRIEQEMKRIEKKNLWICNLETILLQNSHKIPKKLKNRALLMINKLRDVMKEDDNEINV